MINGKLIFTEYNGSTVGFLMKDFKAERIIFDDTSEFRVGSVYIGKVKTVKKDIGAAFVDIADGQSCFLPFDEIMPEGFCNRTYDGRILEGDEICVQVQKEAVKTKQSAVSMHIEIPGTYCVAVMDSCEIRASSKIKKDEADRLVSALSNDLSTDTGLIIRTNAAKADYEYVLSEAGKLSSKLSEIRTIMKTRKVFSRLYEAAPSYISRIEDIPSSGFDEIITDIPEVYAALTEYFESRRFDIRLFKNSDITLKAVYCLERAVNEATSKKVYLSCGGYLVIEPTEALTVIDVNSGKVTSKKSSEDNYDLVNREAAVEIARQLKLRNIFGIIIIDFINYKNTDRAEALITLLRQETRTDFSAVKVCGMTSLGLVEVTRAKKYGSVYDYKKVFDK